MVLMVEAGLAAVHSKSGNLSEPQETQASSFAQLLQPPHGLFAQQYLHVV